MCKDCQSKAGFTWSHDKGECITSLTCSNKAQESQIVADYGEAVQLSKCGGSNEEVDTMRNRETTAVFDFKGQKYLGCWDAERTIQHEQCLQGVEWNSAGETPQYECMCGDCEKSTKAPAQKKGNYLTCCDTVEGDKCPTGTFSTCKNKSDDPTFYEKWPSQSPDERQTYCSSHSTSGDSPDKDTCCTDLCCYSNTLPGCSPILGGNCP
jgi:hypothetical protein